MQRPWISTNLAISADGKISNVNRRPSGWTSRADHQRLLALRQNADALMVGRGTLEADRMTLTVPGAVRHPLRCIVSRTGAVNGSHPLFHSPGGPIHILATDQPPEQKPPGAEFHHQSLVEFIQTLACRFEVQRLHCEGGGSLIRSLAELDLIDEFHVTLAGHTIFGGAASPTATGAPGEWLPGSRVFEITGFEPSTDSGECFLTYRRIRNQ